MFSASKKLSGADVLVFETLSAKPTREISAKLRMLPFQPSSDLVLFGFSLS